MAVWPLRHRKRGLRTRTDLARVPVLVAAFLIALFGFLPATPRSTDITASARPLDDRSDRSPALTKRDPIRAVAIAERKDGAGGHFAHDDGFVPPAFFIHAADEHAAARLPSYQDMATAGSPWPGARPRAPPLAA